jgi:hypothetical protein
MEISPRESKANVGTAASAKMAFHKILYRGSFFFVLLACVASLVVTVTAQEERPQITPGERKPTKKKDSGPRAIGVLQLAANGKASLAPIAILVGGKFWDASAYKADPIPMALEPGTVYEAERAGSSLGLFTVNSALHSNAANVQTPWLGTGSWVPAGTEKPKTSLQAEKEPVGIESNDEPPRLSRGSSPSKQSPSAPPPATTPPASAPPKSTSSGSGQTNPKQTNPSQSTPSHDGSEPADSKSPDAKPTDRPVPPASDSGAGEGNRPRLRRGKPVAPLPEDEIPGYSKPGAVASAAAPANAGTPSQPTADKSSIQFIPAISDASGPEPKSFAFEWLKDEEGERLKQMTALAKEQVRAYMAAQAKSKIMPAPLSKSPHPQAAHRATASKAAVPKTPDPILENVQMKAYDLWGNNQPVMVLTADAHMPPPPAGTPHSEADSDLQYSILLAANPDIYGNLHKLYVGVTDKYHLDMTPRLELVDAVDADGDNRGELLFRETSDNGTGWGIYRATADKLWKLFDSLNPE